LEVLLLILKKFGMTLAVAAALSVGTAGPGGAFASSSGGRIALDRSLPIHPYLQYGAQVQPDRLVRVIVRKQVGGNSQAIAKDANARHISDLRLINSALLQLKQKDVLRLAKDPTVSYVSYDGPVERKSIDTTNLRTAYEQTIGAPSVWNGLTASATGAGVTAAVLDTGVNANHPDLPNVICRQAPSFSSCGDDNGHGTHVMGILKGRDAQGRYIGVAPASRAISIKIGDATGRGTQSDMVSALQWVFDNRVAYNIKVVNISYAAGTPESYMTSPVDAAVEQLWFNGVTVVAASGNFGSVSNATWYAPGNDPFVISVGALDDNGTPNGIDDSLSSFSSRGVTQDGFYKPEIVAPGRKIIAPLASSSATLAVQRPGSVVDGKYIQLSGTSMAAPVVTGVVALLLERNPSLTPNQIKWLLMNTAKRYLTQTDAASVVSASSALQTLLAGAFGTANLGLVPNATINSATGAVTGGQSFWNESYWNESFWNESYWAESVSGTLPDHTYWE
jgi:serine protease AprX